jgi:hypothetical protein
MNAGKKRSPILIIDDVEITETAIIENFESAIAVLSDLRRMGMRISIDDFGTGYSSLSYLKHLPSTVLNSMGLSLRGRRAILAMRRW